MRNNRLLLPSLPIFMAAALLAGCQPAPTEETVEQRAQARWDHFSERNFEAAWEYYSPGFRQMTAREDFALDMRNRPLRWHDAQVNSAECDEDRCTVAVSVTYQPTGASGPQSQMRMTRDIDEQWVRINDRWWYVTN